MSNFITVHKGISKIRFLTLPVTRFVHWHVCPDNKRRPINCTQYKCLMCADGNIRMKLHASIAYDYHKQGIVDLYKGLFHELNGMSLDPRQHDLRIDVIDPMSKWKFVVLNDSPQKIIKPYNDLLLELANKILPYTNDMLSEYLYSIDPGFKLSVINNKNAPLFKRAIDSVKNIFESENISIRTYGALWDGAFNIILANGHSLSINMLAARRLKNGELFCHATNRAFVGRHDSGAFVINPTTLLKTKPKPKIANASLLVHEDGGFEFVPKLDTIIKEAKLEGLLQ